jgi:hypothetical protein
MGEECGWSSHSVTLVTVVFDCVEDIGTYNDHKSAGLLIQCDHLTAFLKLIHHLGETVTSCINWANGNGLEKQRACTH